MATIDARIDASTLEQMLAEDPRTRILDVRTPAEFESVHIPGSYNLPLDMLTDHATTLERELRVPVALVCRTGARADQALDTLASAGMSDLHVLDGGIQAWDDGRRDVRRGRQRWDLERQVRLVAGGLVLAGVVGSIRLPRLKWLSGAVGGGLTFAALSNTCAMGMVLSKLPYNRGVGCDVDRVVAELTASER
ncbi:MAG TPA: rhodanese-like domain-containing protein [Acidimicrobiales bacterium]